MKDHFIFVPIEKLPVIGFGFNVGQAFKELEIVQGLPISTPYIPFLTDKSIILVNKLGKKLHEFLN
jgi:hypothetical protein